MGKLYFTFTAIENCLFTIASYSYDTVLTVGLSIDRIKKCLVIGSIYTIPARGKVVAKQRERPEGVSSVGEIR